MREFKKRLTEVWTYPPICKYSDVIKDQREYLTFLNNVNKINETLIYIHIPFCDSLCFFCSYYKEPINKYSYEDRKAVIDAYMKEIEMYAKKNHLKGVKIKAIQFGGGTPTAIEPEFIEMLLNKINQCFELSECTTISCEGNVKSLKHEERTSKLIEAGVNRFSFGIQTFNENIRKKSGISSKVEDIYKAIEVISKHRGVTYSSDIMYNLPEQTMDDLLSDLHKIDTLGCTYIDAYSLNIFPNTYYSKLIEKGYFKEKPNDKNELEMCAYINSWMKKNNYNQVMVNTYSKVSQKPVDTLDLYLNGSNVIGIGPSSRSFVEGYNFKNVTKLEDYMKIINEDKLPLLAGNKSTEEELIEREFVFFSNYTYIEKAKAKNHKRINEIMKFLITKGYVEEEDVFYRLTEKGMLYPGNISALFYNDVQSEKRMDSFIKSLKYKENPYNQDKMWVV